MFMLKSTHRALMAEQMVKSLNQKQETELYYQDIINGLRRDLAKRDKQYLVKDIDKVINVLSFVRDTRDIKESEDYMLKDIYNNIIVELAKVLCPDEHQDEFMKRLIA